jgi:hypothetical protein
MFTIHFPFKIPIKTLRVLLHVPFSSVDAMTWVTLESQFFKTVTPDKLSNSETISCSNQHFHLGKRNVTKPKVTCRFSITFSPTVRAEQQRTNLSCVKHDFRLLCILMSCLKVTWLYCLGVCLVEEGEWVKGI